MLETRRDALALYLHCSSTLVIHTNTRTPIWCRAGVARGGVASLEIIKFKNCSLGTDRPSNYPQTKGSGRTRSAKISDNLGSKLRAIACNYVKLKEGSFLYGSLYAIFECL